VHRLAVLLVLLAPSTALPWGAEGHHVITTAAVEKLPPALRDAFRARLPALREADVEADKKRGRGAKAERHYIHINVDAHPGHPGRVIDAVLQSYRELVKAFRDHDADAQVRALGDLSHFVADLHQPLHTTSNYEGRDTKNCVSKNSTAHKRFETEFVEKHIDAIRSEVTPQRVKFAPAVRGQIRSQALERAQAAHRQVGELLDVDRAARKRCDAHRPRNYMDAVRAKWLPLVAGQMADAAGWLAGLVVAAEEAAQTWRADEDAPTAER
jgi:hypothetical protein